MLGAHSCCILILSIVLLLFEKSDAQELTPQIRDWDEETLYDLEKQTYIDMRIKYESVIFVKSRYTKDISYFVGRMAFTIRSKYSRLMHMVHRCKLDKGRRELSELSRNATSCQRIFYDVHTCVEAVNAYFKDESPIISEDNIEVNSVLEHIPDTVGGNAIVNDTITSKSTTTTEESVIAQSEEEDMRRKFVRKSIKPDYHVSRNVRKSLNFLGMADYTLRLQRLFKNRSIS